MFLWLGFIIATRITTASFGYVQRANIERICPFPNPGCTVRRFLDGEMKILLLI